MVSGPIEFKTGGRNEIELQYDKNILEQNKENGIENANENPYLLWGIIIVLIVVGGLGTAYAYRTGKLKNIQLPKIKMPALPKMNTQPKQTKLENFIVPKKETKPKNFPGKK